MTFEGQYLTYAEYRELGGTLGQTPFNLLEFEARRKIDIRTQNRLKEKDDIPQEVKLCIYNLIETINNYVVSEKNISDNGNIASVSTDGYSESYVTSSQIKDILMSKENEVNSIIREYLLEVIVDGQHIMFVGVDNANK